MTGRSSPVTRRDILIQKELAVRRTRTSARWELMKEWLEKNVGHWNPEEEYRQYSLVVGGDDQLGGFSLAMSSSSADGVRP
ncbi:hypothetical protein HID58_048160 [Brassica napus]|uniref:Uncharacterized protein n=1 Tax=Brassica napus TaxID=3708 RepID=A0ABQ8B1B2_BRANA|nr:hypothetical protein HID58_048160 [Brassica napus]